MRIDNNFILRERYFALYWGQEVGKNINKRPNLWSFVVNEKHIGNIHYILLKPYAGDDIDLDQQRALGYATPYMNYSIDDLIETGWLRIEGWR